MGIEKRTCSKCHKEKPLTDFYKDKTRPSGFSYICKTCQTSKNKSYTKENRKQYNEYAKNYYHRNRDKILERNKTVYRDKRLGHSRKSALKRFYGLSIEEYEKLSEMQNGVCAICGNPESIPNRPLSVDHCHATNKIRGLLCNDCNTGIGRFKDNVETLQKAINYLEKNNEDIEKDLV